MPEQRSTSAGPIAPVVDCNVIHSWSSPVDVLQYLHSGWREYAAAHMSPAWGASLTGGERPSGAAGASPLGIDLGYYNPLGDFLEDALGEGPYSAGTDPGLVAARHLDARRISAALLFHGIGALIPSHGVTRLSVELTRALNDFTIDRWLAADKRFYAAALVPTQVPQEAAAEIRRVAKHDRVAAIHLCANGLGKPFGHPAYHPIFEAAAEVGLPIAISAGGDQALESPTYPTAAGMPATFTEFRVLAPQALMTHAASIIGQGVPQLYPSLKFLLLGGGTAWVTPFLWRFDTDFKAFRHDLLWLDRYPSEMFQDCFFVGTAPFAYEAAEGRIGSYLDVDHDLGELICYASGYPDTESSTPDEITTALPPAWENGVIGENSLRFFGSRMDRTAPLTTTSSSEGL